MPNAVRIEVASAIGGGNLEGKAREARDFLNVNLERVEEVKVYKIQPRAKAQDISAAVRSVFADPVLQKISFSAEQLQGRTPAFAVEVSFRPGVTDNSARAAETALSLTGIEAIVASGSLFFLYGDMTPDDARKTAQELLANELIQKINVWSYAEFLSSDRFKNVEMPIVKLSGEGAKVEAVSLEISDAALETLSVERCLALTVPELHHIRNHYRDAGVIAKRKTLGLPSDPTDVEIEILAQSWSEHCKHKIFSARIDYQDDKGQRSTVNSLYKSFIKRATTEIAAERKLDWLISVFSDNAGIVRFDDKIDLCIKVETHNSPSALDPYGGALTGILGVNRDIMGAGLGARPIANTDVFCFAPPTMPEPAEREFMPLGPKAPRRILEGVHRGVEDGGNKSGIPTINGAFFFDRDYAGKPLVFVGTVGAMPQKLPDGRATAEKTIVPGDRIVVVGGAVGADGIHGATFSSLEMNDNAPATAVQIGDPITQKRVMDFLMEARDLGLYRAITDNGAGGISSSVGEMATMSGGATLDLALCPVKYPGLQPWELMVSESQERMSLAVPEENKAAFLELAERRDVSATDIGHFHDGGNLVIHYKDKLVADLTLEFLHDSLPQMQLTAHWTGPKASPAWSKTTRLSDRRQAVSDDTGETLIALLQSPNITSKEKWVRAYDHEVQASSHVKPFTGAHSDGPSDSGVIWLYPHGGGQKNAVAVGCGMAPRLSTIDPYLMAQCAVDEAMRNVVASGGDPDTVCLLDNFCWPDPVVSAKNPDGAYKLGQLVRSCQGLFDVCKSYGAPLVSGKDSMKNDFRGKDRRGEKIDISILPTLMVTAMAKTEIGLSVGSDFKTPGDFIYVLGDINAKGFAASEYASLFGEDDGIAPPIDLKINMSLYRKLYQSLKARLVASVHDLSDGGLLVALAESMIGGRLGAKVSVSGHALLFNEAPGRFVVSVSAEKQEEFEKIFQGLPCHLIGSVEKEAVLAVCSEKIGLAALVAAWKKGF